jgi:hypothetical protein
VSGANGAEIDALVHLAHARGLDGDAAHTLVCEQLGVAGDSRDVWREPVELRLAKLRASSNGAGPADIAAALEGARVDLIQMLEHGIAPRRLVPGAGGWLVAGKRHHIAAERKTGKSLAIGVVAAVDIVTAGGSVAVLDRENGADEYVRRLHDVLEARAASVELRERVRRELRYYAWPTLKLEWSKSPAYPAAFDGVAAVIFDSSRKFLTSVGLKEDLSDDYSTFAEALIDPLMQAGIAPVILDNTGHSDNTRARGSSSKGDLADVIFTLRKTVPFDTHTEGQVELAIQESRFGDVSGAWTLRLGGGRFDSWGRPQANDLREIFRATCVDVLTQQHPLGRDALLEAVRGKRFQVSNETARDWLAELTSDPTSGLAHTDRHGYDLT